MAPTGLDEVDTPENSGTSVFELSLAETVSHLHFSELVSPWIGRFGTLYPKPSALWRSSLHLLKFVTSNLPDHGDHL